MSRSFTRRERTKPTDEVRGGTITAMSTQVRHPDRVSVFLDGDYAFGLPALVAAQARLEVGQALSPTEVMDLMAKDEVARATEAAITLLAHRPRSTRELEQRLRQKGYAAEAISGALARLVELHYLDDADFARFWVANRQANRPRGRRLLEQELRHKGVERELIDEAIAEAELDEPAAALNAGRTKLRTYSGLEPAVARRRLAAYLGRRGYSYDIIRGVLAQLFSDEDDNGESGE